MVCSCGNPVPETASFCKRCGKKIERPAAAPGGTPLMVLEDLALYKGKQPFGDFVIYSDRVEFVHSGENFVAFNIIRGIVGAIISIVKDAIKKKKKPKPTEVDCFPMSAIAMASECKHPKISSYVEIVFKDGKKLKYLDRTGKNSIEEMLRAADLINELV